MSDDRPPFGDWFREDGGEPSDQGPRLYGSTPQPQPIPQQRPPVQPTAQSGDVWEAYGVRPQAQNGSDAPSRPQAQGNGQPPVYGQPGGFGQYGQQPASEHNGGFDPTRGFQQIRGYEQPRPAPDEQAGPQYPEYVPHPHDRRGQSSRRVPLIAGGTVAGVAVLALIGYLTLGGGAKPASHAAAASPSPTHTSFQPTSTDPAVAAEQMGTAFLTAWQSGDLQKAAKYTDNPTAALAALTEYKTDLNVSALALTPKPAIVTGATPAVSGSGSSAPASPTASSATADGSPSGTVPFSVTATVAMPAQAPTGQSDNASASATATAPTTALPWNYSSNLLAYKQSDGWSVKWAASILAPSLTDGQKFAVVAVPPGTGKVEDASGNNLASSSDTALRNISAAMTKQAPAGQGTAGVAVEITDASGKAVAGTSTTLQPPVNATVLKTTISPTAEALAEHAVGMNPKSSMVVLRASTGQILAVANSAGISDIALTGNLAPGSTFKIVTSTALLANGDVTVNTPVACPLTYTVEGITFHNATNGPGTPEESEPDGTPFLKDFADSCNNAFTPFWTKLGGGRLASAASGYYGLGKKWDIGLGPNTYFGMPSASAGSELAQEDFGQGQVEANPLAMASVAATVGTGRFHQPYLVDGVTKATANPLPSGTDSALKQMMHAVVTEGTAAGVFSSVGGTLYAKTGTAEADANKDGKTNGWIVVYDPAKDLAVGAVVVDSGFGAQYAGPEAAYVLAHM
ncbi:MAG TPA: penicillin-binding transpeptidase domain-containing protein [Actinocrinis sp.]|nr:penicillin-binding transpeptidase domain-containing protein [Actinocrinis sp.]